MDVQHVEGRALAHLNDDKGVVPPHGSSSADKTMLYHPKAEAGGREEGDLEKNENRNENEGRQPAHEDEEMFKEMTLKQEMELEKHRYPGASSWAPDEERLFEILFQRQDISILPHHWALDFAGAPMPENVFDGPDEKKAIVYAIRESDFAVTSAIQRLIFLTGDAIAICECGHDAKAPKLIKKRVKQFLKVVAQDAGYDDLDFIPNIFVEPVSGLRRDYIGDYMTARMKSLAWLQRQFLRSDRVTNFQDDVAPTLLHPRATKQSFLNQFLQVKKRKVGDDDAVEGEVNYLELGALPYDQSTAHRDKRPRLREETPLTPHIDQSDVLMHGTTPEVPLKQLLPSEITQSSKVRDSTSLRPLPSPGISPWTKLEPRTPSPPMIPAVPFVQYRHKPPVLYGLFIVNTNVFLLTIDSYQEQDAKVTYHLNMDFADSNQSVWNALTIAIVACLAREHVRGVMQNFDCTRRTSESDPDA